jgi:hypothetical protein
MMLTHKKTLIGIVAGLTLGLIGFMSGGQSFVIESALAVTPGSGTGTSNIFSTTANLAAIMAEFMLLLSFIIIYLLQALLDPSFLNNVITGSLKDIWIFSRDLMNVIFAFMLVAAGIFTVVTGNKEMVQSKYKKFILAIILVNFSWFFPRVIIDVANVLTATIYNIPAGMQVRDAAGNLAPVKCEYEDETGTVVPCKAVTKLLLAKKCKEKITAQDSAGTPTTDPDYYLGYVANFVCVHYDEIGGATGPSQSTSAGMLNGLVLGHGRLGSLTRVLNPSSGPGAAGTEMERLTSYFFFLMHILIVMSLMMMLFLPLLSMLVVFIIRIPIIWFTVAFMPFMFIGFVAEDKITPGFNTFDIFKKFVKAAFLPVALAVPLCIGFILLSTVGTSDCATTLGAGSPMCLKTGAVVSGVDNAWSLLWLLMTFFVIWTGFFAAMKIDETYVNVTNGIKNFGSSIGQSALKLPMSIPIPTGGGKSMTLNQLKNAPRRLSANLENQSAGKALAGAFGGSSSGGGADSVTDTLKDSQSPMNKALAAIAQNTSGGVKVNKTTGKIDNFADVKAHIANELNNNRGSFEAKLKDHGVSEEQIKQIKPEAFLKGLTENQSSITSAIKESMKPETPPPATP